MFMTMTGTQMVHVPYRGETLVLQDMLGGHVDLFFGNVSAALALWRDGKIKVLAVLDKKRSAQMPDVPTTAEAGMPDLVSVGWFAVAGAAEDAAGAARPDRQGLHRGAEDAGRAGEVPRARASSPAASTPAETAAFIKDEARAGAT